MSFTLLVRGGSTKYFFYFLASENLYDPYAISTLAKNYYTNKNILNFYISSYLIDVDAYLRELRASIDGKLINGKLYLKAIYASTGISYVLKHGKFPNTTNIWSFVDDIENGAIVSKSIEEIKSEMDASYELSHADISVYRIASIDAYIDDVLIKAQSYLRSQSFVKVMDRFNDFDSFLRTICEKIQ